MLVCHCVCGLYQYLNRWPIFLYRRLHKSLNFSFFIHIVLPRLHFGFLVDDMQFSRYDCSESRVISFFENFSSYIPHGNLDAIHEAEISQIDFL